MREVRLPSPFEHIRYADFSGAFGGAVTMFCERCQTTYTMDPRLTLMTAESISTHLAAWAEDHKHAPETVEIALDPSGIPLIVTE